MKNDLVMVMDTRKRLFEMMERVAGMPIIKETNSSSTNFEGLTLPPGFGADDFITPDEMKEMGCVPNATVNEIRKLREAKKGEKSPVVYGSMGGDEATPMEGVKIRHIPRRMGGVAGSPSKKKPSKAAPKGSVSTRVMAVGVGVIFRPARLRV